MLQANNIVIIDKNYKLTFKLYLNQYDSNLIF